MNRKEYGLLIEGWRKFLFEEDDARGRVKAEDDEVIEFQTAQGSIYTYDRKLRMSSREKRSGGSGQGEVKPFMNVVFIDKMIPLYVKKYRCIVIMGKDGDFVPIDKVPTSLEKNEKLGIYIAERQSGNFVEIVDAFLEPEIGLRPFEWGIDDEKRRIRHLGNKIVDIRERT